MHALFGSVKIYGRLAAFILSVVALALVFQRIKLTELWEVLRGANLLWVLAAAGLFALAMVIAAARWHLVLKASHLAVHPAATLKSVLIGHLFNTFLFGPAGGDVAKSAIYSRWYQLPASSVLATCMVDRLLGGAGFVVFALFAPAVAWTSGRGIPWQPNLVSSGRLAGVLAALLILAGLGILLHRRTRPPAFLERMIATFKFGIHQLVAQPRSGSLGVLLAFLAHLCMNGMLLLCLMGVTRQTFSAADLLWTLPVISLISSAPVTFAGTGLREGAALVLLGLYRIPAADAVAASLLVLVLYLLWAAFSGWLLWSGERRRIPVANQPSPQTISVIVPTLNEELALTETVRRARQNPHVTEIIVADGGSSDRTPQIARQLGCDVVQASGGRGGQMRAGAARAQGDVVLLLHADTWLPQNATTAIMNSLRDPNVVGGGLWKSFRGGNWLMAGSRFRCLIRLYLGGRVAGDQALFVRRRVLDQIGGVPDMPLMEEFELCKRMRAAGSLALASATVLTSARRFTERGVLRTYWRMWSVTIRYYMGVPAADLHRSYERK